MALSAKTIQAQLCKIKPLLNSNSLESVRRGQDLIGELVGASKQSQFVVRNHRFQHFTGAWVIPRDERRQGVILYLHGGGYTCGGLEYARGFGMVLAGKMGVRVFCPAYRLAPENPFPAALEDALEAYRYLLEKGYQPAHIALCGESAGGGLCYSLCQKLKKQNLPQPGCIVSFSPWTDLTFSGDSYEKNIQSDPTLSLNFLDFCRRSYGSDYENPLISPLLGDLQDMPPSQIFVAEGELLQDDGVRLHEKLLLQGCISTLQVKADRWHAYVMYQLKEDEEDFRTINRFLNRYMCREKKLQWMRLDNAAKIYPAARNQNWSNVFRVSATMTDPIDVPVMQSALDVTARRFPSIAARLRRGSFWYYLQQVKTAPRIRPENSYPLVRMSRREARECALRVIVYKNRVALEMFHSLTDGNGAMVFLKTLLAEYVQEKYGVSISNTHGVLGRLEEPSPEELEDSFLKYAGPVNASRKGTNAWRISGTPEPDGFLNLTCFQFSTSEIVEQAHRYGVSVTAFLCAVMMQAFQQLQKEQVPNIRKRKAIKVLIPVNLRRMFPSKSLRNFVLYTTPEFDPRLGEFSFEEICQVVHHSLAMGVTPKMMGMLIAVNVNSERSWLVKIMPLFVKNLVMKSIFKAQGERKSCLTLSNLGAADIPEELKPYVQWMDFVLGVQASCPYNCGVISYGDEMRLNFIRNTREPQLEVAFYKVLKELGIHATLSSNREQGGM